MKYEGLTGETHRLEGVSSYEEVLPVSIGENLWEIDLGTNWWNPIVYLRVMQADEQKELTFVVKSDGRDGNGTNRQPKSNGEWGRWEGGDLQTSKVHLYWDDRTPEVRYGLAQKPAVVVNSCTDCTFIVSGQYAGYGVKITDSVNCKVVAQFDEVGRGVEVKNCENILVTGGEFTNVGESGIRYHSSTGVAEYNTVTRGGLSESIAGIYLTKSVEGVTARNNSISHYEHGNYWPHDGCGIFTENDSANNKVLDNTISYCPYAFKDNSGKPGNRFFNNKIYSCEWPYQKSDSKGYGEADTRFEQNILSGTNTCQPGGSVLVNNIVL